MIGSTDVKALYPSLDIEFTIEKVCEVFKESNVQVSEIDSDELGLYLALTHNVAKLEELGFTDFCPTRDTVGRPPTITSSGKKEKKEDRFAPWDRATSAPDRLQQRKMLTEALRVGLTIVMKNHVYEFDGEIRQQRSGGAIGLELTGNLAQVFMIWWDRELKFRLSNSAMLAALYKRNVDDINLVLKALQPGTRYLNGSVYIEQEAMANDLGVAADARTMAVVKAIGNDIHPSIQLEVDFPSNHVDNKMPSLDLKLWIERVEGSTYIMHEFYSKDVSSNLVVHAKSALSWPVKRTVLPWAYHGSKW